MTQDNQANDKPQRELAQPTMSELEDILEASGCPFLIRKDLTKAIQAYTDRAVTDKERETLKKPNELLRSAYQITEREYFHSLTGKAHTNWLGFRNRLEAELEREHKIMYPEAKLTISVRDGGGSSAAGEKT